MKSISKSIFDAADSLLTPSDTQSDTQTDQVVHGLDFIEPLEVPGNPSGNGVDVNLIHVLDMLGAGAAEAPAVAEEAVQVEQSSEAAADASVNTVIETDLVFAGGGSRLCLPYVIDPVVVDQGAENSFPSDVADNIAGDATETVSLTGEPEVVFPEDAPGEESATVDESLVPSVGVLEPAICIDMPIVFKGPWIWIDGDTWKPPVEGIDGADEVDGSSGEALTEVPETVSLNGEPVVIFPEDAPETGEQDIEPGIGDVGATAEAEFVDDGATVDEAVDPSTGALLPEDGSFEIIICVDKPIWLGEPMVFIDDGTFDFNFPEVFVVQPFVDEVDENLTDTTTETVTDITVWPEIMVCEGYPPLEVNAVEITLTGVAESHLA